MTEGFGGEVDLLEGQALEAVASLWRKTGRQLRARFGGSSMRPALPPGTEVLLSCGEPGGTGDVIAFLAEGRLVVHRVVARAPDGSWTLTRGDARVLPDVPILDPDAVLGRVAGVWRAASLEEVPVGPDSPPRRFVLRIFSAVLQASPRAGAAALRGLHTVNRLARTLPLWLGRPPAP
jgi:hypothetical protein